MINKKDITIILLAEVGVILMGFIWVFLFGGYIIK